MRKECLSAYVFFSAEDYFALEVMREASRHLLINHQTINDQYPTFLLLYFIQKYK